MPSIPGSIRGIAAGAAIAAISNAHPDTAIASEHAAALRAMEGAAAPITDPVASRSRAISLDISAISPEARASTVVEFPLFENEVFRAARRSVSVIEDGRWTWLGDIEGEPGATALFSVRDGVAAGVIRSPERGVFRVRFTGEPGVYVAEQIDPANMLPCATGEAEAVTRPGEAPDEAGDAPEAAERGFKVTTIDLLVGYTPQARSLAGGTSGMLAEIDLAIASANQAFANSAVDVEFNLVLTHMFAYNETGNANSDLSSWRNSGDGFMDEVHVLRDDIAADMCALIVGSLNACGIAYLMTNPSTAFEDRAFSVTALSCAVSNLSFAHECGHNLGCAHDRDNASTGAYSYSFGYRDPQPPADWRTVMAYAPGSRIAHFSNPLVGFQGLPTGVLSGPNAADNAKTLNLTRGFARHWRDASTRQPLQFDLDSPDPGESSLHGEIEFSWETNGPVDSYTLIVANDAGLTDIVYEAGGLLTSEHTAPFGAFEQCRTYHWGVVASLAGNPRSATPESRAFTTRLAADVSGDGDGVVDTADIGFVISNFGMSCNP